MKHTFYWFTAVLFISGTLSCTKAQQTTTYTAVPKTVVGTRLVNQTDLFATIHSDTSYTIKNGLTATEIKYLSKEGLAMKIFIFEVDLSNPKLTIEASTPFNQPQYNMQEITLQATYEDAENHKVWAGINGDFYNMTTGMPQGIVHKEGLVIKSTFTDALNTFVGITNDNKAIVGDQALYASVKTTLKEAISGRVTLIKEGIIENQPSAVVEPRTAIGVSQDGLKVYMLAVDGRKFHYSNGMKYEDLAKVLKALGAYNAINLDGGGSTTFFIRNSPGFEPNRFEIRNWPTDNGGKERAVANGLLIISKD